MKQILILSFILLSMFKVNAQSQCATDEYDAYLKRTNPTYASERQKMEQQIYSILKNKQNNPNARIGANDCTIPQSGVYTLPVVVHVIHKGEAIGTGFNISDAQIQGAIQGMNERWRRIQGDGVDLEVQFALAVRDTNNNATNGITRFDGRIFPNYAVNGNYNVGAPGASAVTIMDSTVWDRSKYINIWVVDLRDACGYASLGIAYSFFMSYDCMDYNSGTLSHEMGHAFGLHHTFAGDGSGSGLNPSTQCPPNGDCLLYGDWVCDTPPHRKEECSVTNCTTSGDLQNSFKNYMSYCGGTRFTQGQKDRVRTSLYSDNFWSLVMSDGLIPISTPLEVGIASLENNLDEPICNNFIPKIKIKNSGTTTITNLKIATYVDGAMYNTKTISTNLLRNAINTFNLNSIVFNSVGQHNLKFVITEMNSSTTDFQELNNQVCKDILVRNNPVSTFCLNLEDNNINSIIYSLDSTNIPKLTSINGCSNIGNKALKYDNTKLLYDNNTFYLPNFNLDSVYSAFLVFDHAYKQGKVSSLLNLIFMGAKGCDSLPFVIRGFNSSNLASVQGRDSINSWLPTNCSHWKKDSVNLSNYKGVNNLLIKCMAYNYGDIYFSNQPLYLDNFCIHKRYKVYANINYIGAGYYTYSNGNGVYDESSSATISATVYGCYTFKNWTENGVIVSTNPSYTFTVNKNRNLIANFERKLIPLSLSTYPQNIATVIGAGTYPCDTSIYILVRNIDTNYVFDYWHDSINNIYLWDSTSFAYISNASHYYYTAYFKPKQYTLNVNTNYVGSPQFNYNYSLNLLYNSNYRLEADTTARQCYKFKNWTKDGIIVSSNPLYNITIKGNESYVANYERKQNLVSLTTNNIYGGSISGAGTYDCGSYVTLTATPNSCYDFKYWEENNILILSYNQSFTTYLYENRIIKAVFEPKYRYNLSLTPNPSNGGTVLGSGNFACDTLVTVKAKIKTGYKFTNWTEGSTIVSTDSIYSFRISGNRNLKANFSIATGIKQTTINEISKVFPNPAKDILQVEIRSKQNTSLTLNIIDMKGSLLETKTLSNSKGTFNTSFDVSKLSKGNYILNLYDEEGMASYKFIVQ